MTSFWYMGVVNKNGSISPRRVLQRRNGHTCQAKVNGSELATIHVRDDGSLVMYDDSVDYGSCSLSLGKCTLQMPACYAASLPDSPELEF